MYDLAPLVRQRTGGARPPGVVAGYLWKLRTPHFGQRTYTPLLGTAIWSIRSCCR